MNVQEAVSAAKQSARLKRKPYTVWRCGDDFAALPDVANPSHEDFDAADGPIRPVASFGVPALEAAPSLRNIPIAEPLPNPPVEAEPFRYDPEPFRRALRTRRRWLWAIVGLWFAIGCAAGFTIASLI